MSDTSPLGPIALPPATGAIPAAGLAAIIRIPVPGTQDLAIELSPRNFQGRSTSVLFIQNLAGRPHLRLDFGDNPRTGTVDYHWNQRGTFGTFGIRDHTPLGRGGAILYQGARVFKYAGRSILAFGLARDAYSIVVADRPLRRAGEVATAWAAAFLAARTAGTAGAAVGSVAGPVGIAVGGIVFAVAGGAFGYWLGEAASGAVFEWAEGTRFCALVEEPVPVGELPRLGGRSSGGGASGSW